MKEKVVVLDRERIAHKLRRMAYEIWEHNSEEQKVILIGIERGGRSVADNLGRLLTSISPVKAEVYSLVINKKEPLQHSLEFDKDLTGCSVVLVDDVANSGKTMAYALSPILKYNLRKLLVAVLVDRKHKSFPISSDIVGLTIATTLQEHIEVEIEHGEITSVYLQ